MGYPKFGKTIADMTAEVRAVNVEKGWRPAAGGPVSNTFGDYIALAHSELSEALEAYRDHRLEDATATTRTGTAIPWAKPEGVGSELADVLIRLLDMADVFGIDLEREYERKIAYNRTRAFRHGGRTLADDSAQKSDFVVVSREPAGPRPVDEDDSGPEAVAGQGCWPGAVSGETDPRCCRFPKSCSVRTKVPAFDVPPELFRRASLIEAMPTDPRDWWIDEEVDEFLLAWSLAGMPEAKMADATGGELTIWTDLAAAARMLGMEIKDSGYGPHVEIVSGAYTVGIVPPEK